MNKSRLPLVYNAGSGLFDAAAGRARKRPRVEILVEAADIEAAYGCATLITEVEAALADWFAKRG